MPTYAYECGACGHNFEQFQSITSKALRKCPECSKLKLQRLIGPGAGIIFKGSGFYETDYRSDNYTKGRKTETDAGSASEKPATTGDSPATDQAKPAGPEAKTTAPEQKKRKHSGN